MDTRASRIESAVPALACAGAPWWLQAGTLALVLSRMPGEGAEAHYSFGDACLTLTAPRALLAELEDRYGECAMPARPDAGVRTLRCAVHARADGLTLVNFTAPPVDGFGTALALLEHPVGRPLFAEAALPAAGWRLITRTGSGVPLVAARGGLLLIDTSAAPDGFLPDLLLSPVLATQREFLFVHAASIAIGGAGLLLIGKSGSGKTTTVLTLAARGHGYLGDDMAALHAESAMLLPLRRTAHLRPGPHTRALAPHVETGRWDPPHADGQPRLPLRVTDLFPGRASARVPLRRVLFLRRFAAEPAIEPFQVDGTARGSLAPLALNNALWLAWGTTPPRRLLQFMLFMRLLTRVRCAWLDVGGIEATADLIETTMEDSWD